MYYAPTQYSALQFIEFKTKNEIQIIQTDRNLLEQLGFSPEAFQVVDVVPQKPIKEIRFSFTFNNALVSSPPNSLVAGQQVYDLETGVLGYAIIPGVFCTDDLPQKVSVDEQDLVRYN